MKNLVTLFVSLLLISFSARTQDFPTNEKGEVAYTNVIQLDGLSQKEIYEKSKLWVVSTLKSGDNMVELSGSNSNQIVGTGNLVLGEVDLESMIWRIYNPALNFKFIVSCKDDKLKYEISNITYNYILSTGEHKEVVQTNLIEFKMNKHVKEKLKNKFKEKSTVEIQTQIKRLIDDFVSTMKSSEKDDW